MTSTVYFLDTFVQDSAGAGAAAGEESLRTLDRHITAYVSERRKRGDITASTAVDLRSRLYSLSESFGARPLSHLTEPAILRWLGTIGHMRASSRRAYLSTVRQFAQWMVRRRRIKSDPTVELAKIKEPRYVPRALPATKVSTLLHSRPDLRSQAILWLMVGGGLRCSEVAGLQVDDYDLGNQTLFVKGKGSNERLLPVPILLQTALNLYLDETGWLSGPLVRSLNDPTYGLRGDTMSKLVASWMIDCGGDV